MPVLRQLVEVHHAEINAVRENSPEAVSLMHLACRLDRADLVEFLIAAPRINVNLALGLKMTPLHFCLAGPSIRALRLLLAVPQIQVNATTFEGVSCLLLACLTDKAAVVEQLLRHPDVDVNVLTDASAHRCPPLAAAAIKGHSAIVMMLLQHPAIQINATYEGMTPLYMACAKGHAHMVHELLRHPDAQVNLQSTDGVTPLAAACAAGHLVVIRELLEHPGLDAGSIRAALTSAVGRGQAVVVALLRESRAGRRALRGQGGA